MKLRKNGITLLEDAEEFEREVAKRERNKDLAKKDKRLAAATVQSTPNAPSTDTPSSRRSSPAPPPPPKRSHPTQNPPAKPPASTENIDTTPLGPSPEKRKRNLALPKLAPFKDILTEKTPHNLRSPTNGCQLRDLLSENEKRLCKRIGMKTASYVTIKTSILKDYLNRQHGTPVKLRFPAGYDKTHRRTILNFLEHSGWIQLEN